MEFPLRRMARSAPDAPTEAAITTSATADWNANFTDSLTIRTKTLRENGLFPQHLLNRRGHAILIVRQSDRPAPGLQFMGCISHDKRDSGERKHFNVIIVITDGHDLSSRNTTVPRPSLERMTLGAVAIEHINDREVT